MKRPERTINKALGREGRGLAAWPWLRVVMAALLGLSGVYIFFDGLPRDLVQMVLGGVFTVYAVLVCFMIRRAERIIRLAESKVEHLEELHAKKLGK